jgi:hypothetical protein
VSDVPRMIYIPILHSRKEAGDIIASLSDDNVAQKPIEHSSGQENSIKEMWDGIYEKINEIGLRYHLVRIYQDALPVCGMEDRIVKKLAGKGSLNHQIVLDLMKKGARLEGSEDPDLLIKEYSYLEQLISEVSGSAKAYRQGISEYKKKSVKLMKQRDVFIAERIKGTIKAGEIPLVFMGVRHELEKFLRPYFVITHIIYRLPFKTIGDIYNV